MYLSKTHAQDKGFNLTAAKTYTPSTFDTAEKTFSSPVKFTVSQTIPVLEGNSGNHDCNITYRLDGEEYIINYKGGSDQAHPNSPDQIAKGKQYIFNSCTDPSIGAGDIITCDYIKLNVLNGDSHLDETVVSLYFQPVMFESNNDTIVLNSTVQVNNMTVKNQLRIGEQSIHMQTPETNEVGDNEIYSTDDLYIQSNVVNEEDDDLILVSQKEGDNEPKGNVGIGTNDPEKKLHVNGDILFNGSLLHDGQEIGVWEKNGNSIEYTSGNVGIGKSPSRNLDIAGTTRTEEFEVENIHLDGNINFNTSSFPLQITTNSDGGGSDLEFRTTWATKQGEFNTTTQMTIGGGYESSYILFSDQNERDFVLFNGRDKKVDITGDLDFTGTLSRDGQEVGLWTLQGNELYTDKDIKVEGTNGYIKFPYAGWFLKVNNNRDVQALFQNMGGTAGIELYNGNHDRLRLTQNMDNEFVIKNYHEDNERLIINEQGKTIINSLEVSESVYNVFIGKSKLYEGAYGWGTGYIGFNAEKKSDDHWHTADDGANNGAVVMYANIGGDLFFSGIPSTGTGNQMLDDNQLKNNIIMQINSNSDGGNVIVRELRVKTPILPDYVFDKGYDLMSLTDLNNYINEHQSLPGIPKEKEAIENGIDVGEMQIKLLEKVEELTLHMINQEKKIERLKEEKEELKKKNNKIDELEREIDELKKILKNSK